MPGWAWRDGRDSRRALGNGYAPRRRRGWHDRGRRREGKREKRRSCLRRPHGIRRRLTGRPVFSYGRHMVCTRWPKGLLALAMRDATWINLFLSSSIAAFFIICSHTWMQPPRFDHICLSKSRQNQINLHVLYALVYARCRQCSLAWMSTLNCT